MFVSLEYSITFYAEYFVHFNYNGRKINAWSTNEFSNELHTAVWLAFNVPFSKVKCWKTALIYSFIADLKKGEELGDRPIGN